MVHTTTHQLRKLWSVLPKGVFLDTVVMSGFWLCLYFSTCTVAVTFTMPLVWELLRTTRLGLDSHVWCATRAQHHLLSPGGCCQKWLVPLSWKVVNTHTYHHKQIAECKARNAKPQSIGNTSFEGTDVDPILCMLGDRYVLRLDFSSTLLGGHNPFPRYQQDWVKAMSVSLSTG